MHHIFITKFIDEILQCRLIQKDKSNTWHNLIHSCIRSNDLFLIKYWVHWFRATIVEYTNVNLHRVVQLLHASHGLGNSNSHNNYNSNNNYNRRKVIPKKKKLEYLDTQSHSYSTLISPWLLPQFKSYQTESRENYMYYLKTIPCL